MDRKFYTNDKGQRVGNLYKGVFRKEVKKSKHLMRNMNGYGLDKSIVEALSLEGCKEIRILDTDSQVVHSVAFATFKEKGVSIDYVGLQVCLPLTEFETKSAKT